MADSVFDRETMLDISVNIVPMVIIAFFVGVMFVIPAWGFSPFYTGIALGLHVIPFVLLALLTYVSAKAIEG